jgi:adenylyl-sulfate kinase
VAAAGDGAPDLVMNGIADCVIALPSQIAFDTFRDDPEQGALILIDRETGATAAAGVATRAMGQANNIHASAALVTRDDHERLNGHRGGAIWLTGLSGAGKSTIAAELQGLLHGHGVRTVLLDGDNLRHGLNRDLGFSTEDRAENVRRTGEVARLFAEAGIVAICALISPRRVDRDAVRDRFEEGGFVEVFVDAPLDVCRTRDPKGLYARATSGEIRDLTGVGSSYEAPLEPDLVLHTGQSEPGESAVRVLDLVRGRGWLAGIAMP